MIRSVLRALQPNRPGAPMAPSNSPFSTPWTWGKETRIRGVPVQGDSSPLLGTRSPQQQQIRRLNNARYFVIALKMIIKKGG
jgi:hypothetical protein